jgi:hypothetical protein
MRIPQSYVYNENMMPQFSTPQSLTPSPRTSILHSPLPTPYSLLLLFLFLSCQTAPKTPDVFPDDAAYIPLNSGASAYIAADIQNARFILNDLDFININDEQFQQMLDQTQFAVAGIYAPQGARRYQLTAWGSYPASKAKIALGASKGWKKQRSQIAGDDYWYSAKEGLSIAITAGRAFVSVASGNAPDIPTDPFPVTPGTVIPEGFNQFREGSILSCWFADPGPAINQKLMEMGLPLEIPAQQLFVSLFPEDEENPAEKRTAENQRYVAHLQIQVAEETQARALTMMFALVRNFIPLQADANNPATLLPLILFANPPAQDGNNLRITAAPLSAQEIALLLKFFSL